MPKKNFPNFRQLAKTIGLLLAGKKAEDILILDVRKLTYLTDYFLIACGNSTIHLRTLRETLENKLAKERIYPFRKEGAFSSGWQVLDYGGVIVHLFLPEIYKFYHIDKLWQGARKVSFKSRINTNRKIRVHSCYKR